MLQHVAFSCTAHLVSHIFPLLSSLILVVGWSYPFDTSAKKQSIWSVGSDCYTPPSFGSSIDSRYNTNPKARPYPRRRTDFDCDIVPGDPANFPDQTPGCILQWSCETHIFSAQADLIGQLSDSTCYPENMANLPPGSSTVCAGLWQRKFGTASSSIWKHIRAVQWSAPEQNIFSVVTENVLSLLPSVPSSLKPSTRTLSYRTAPIFHMLLNQAVQPCEAKGALMAIAPAGKFGWVTPTLDLIDRSIPEALIFGEDLPGPTCWVLPHLGEIPMWTTQKKSIAPPLERDVKENHRQVKLFRIGARILPVEKGILSFFLSGAENEAPSLVPSISQMPSYLPSGSPSVSFLPSESPSVSQVPSDSPPANGRWHLDSGSCTQICDNLGLRCTDESLRRQNNLSESAVRDAFLAVGQNCQTIILLIGQPYAPGTHPYGGCFGASGGYSTCDTWYSGQGQRRLCWCE